MPKTALAKMSKEMRAAVYAICAQKNITQYKAAMTEFNIPPSTFSRAILGHTISEKLAVKIKVLMAERGYQVDYERV